MNPNSEGKEPIHTLQKVVWRNGRAGWWEIQTLEGEIGEGSFLFKQVAIRPNTSPIRPQACTCKRESKHSRLVSIEEKVLFEVHCILISL
jgi:hypothetical protein